jgi:hypothetical protein
MKFSSFAGTLVAASIIATAGAARAEFKVRSPIVEKGEVAVEVMGSITNDRNPAKSNEQSHVVELEIGVTDFWMTELEGEWGRDAGPGNNRKFEATTWGNKFQVFPQGERWLDLGMWAEYSMASASEDADKIKIGPLLQKSLGPTTTTANFYLEKQIGANAQGGAGASYAVQLRYDWLKELSPALEAYGDLGEINRTHAVDNQTHRLGPVLTGAFGLGRAGEFKYEVGYLGGLSAATAAHTFKWKAEYEIAF